MKKISIFIGCFLTIAFVSGQVNDEPTGNLTGLRHQQRLTSHDCTGSAYFYRQDLCMSSVNTATFYTFMDWLKDKVHYPGMQAGILHDGELVWKGNWGMASIEENKPVTDETAFRLLSVSKTFVGTSIMKLWEDGLLELNGNIHDYLPFEIINPWYPQSVVNPKMILNHTSSFTDSHPGSGPECGTLEFIWDPQVSLHDFLVSHFIPGGICYDNSVFFNYPPGTYSYYSNPGAALGGYIVESITGKGFSEYCNDSIFSLLDMPGSRWFYSELDTAKVAVMYEWNGSSFNNLGARSYAGYPLGDLKSNATELANFIKMYINHGNYNGIHMLDSASIEMMTTITDTLLPFETPIGLIWQYYPPYQTWYHDGATGSMIEFHKERRSGTVLTDNKRTGAYEPTLVCSHMHMTYEELSISTVNANDTDGDHLLETGETVEVVTGIFNNLMTNAENVSLTLRCSDPAFIITDSVAYLGTIAAGQSEQNQSQPFSFQVSEITEPHTVMMDVEVNFNYDKTILIHFPLFTGQVAVLLLKDERDVLNSERFYLDVLDSLGLKTHYWDLAVHGNPDFTFLKNFPVIIWYTGYDQDSTLSEMNQLALMNYLDQGGKLFLTGQNISDEIGESSFMSNYMHAGHLINYNTLNIHGIDGDPVGDGMVFDLNANILIPSQYAQSRIVAVNGGIPCFKYGTTSAMAGVRYENELYKTVFLGFGFESLDLADRYALMKRVLEYFDIITGVKEISANTSDRGCQVYPNPSSGLITISLPEISANTQIVIYSAGGMKVLEWQPADTETRLDISALPPGVYFVKLRNEKMVEVEKIIKK